MAQIQEYEPQVEAAGPVGATQPNLELSGAVGNAISRVGGAVEETSDIIYRKNAQAETTQAYSWASQKRAEYTNKIKAGIADGTLDDKAASDLNQQFQNEVSQQADNYSTAAGKNYFTRQAARLGSTVVQRTAAGSAQVAGMNNDALLQQSHADNEQAISTDPSQLSDVLGKEYEFLDAQVQNGVLSKKDALQARQDTAVRYARTAIQATAQMSPETAKAALDSGYFRQWLNPDQMKEAYGEVHTVQNESNAQYKFDQEKQKADDAAQQEKIKSGYMDQIDKGTANLQTLASSGLDTKTRENLATYANQVAQRQMEVRGPVITNYTKRLLLPSNDPNFIGSNDQLLQEVANGKINPAERAVLSKSLANTSENIANKASKSALMKVMNQQLNNAPMFPGSTMTIKDPTGPYKVSQAITELHAKEEEFRAANKPLATLYDPNSPDYFGKQVSKFKTTGPDVAADQANHIRTQFNTPPKTQPAEVVPMVPGAPVIPSTATPPKGAGPNPPPTGQGPEAWHAWLAKKRGTK